MHAMRISAPVSGYEHFCVLSPLENSQKVYSMQCIQHGKKNTLIKMLLMYRAWLRGLLVQNRPQRCGLLDLQGVVNSWLMCNMLQYVTVENKSASDAVCLAVVRQFLVNTKPDCTNQYELMLMLTDKFPCCSTRVVQSLAHQYIADPEALSSLTSNHDFNQVVYNMDSEELEDFAQTVILGPRAHNQNVRVVDISKVLDGSETLPAPGYCMLFRSLAQASCRHKTLEERKDEMYHYDPTIKVCTSS